jgi:hypothetical protein
MSSPGIATDARPCHNKVSSTAAVGDKLFVDDEDRQDLLSLMLNSDAGDEMLKLL